MGVIKIIFSVLVSVPMFVLGGYLIREFSKAISGGASDGSAQDADASSASKMSGMAGASGMASESGMYGESGMAGTSGRVGKSGRSGKSSKSGKAGKSRGIGAKKGSRRNGRGTSNYGADGGDKSGLRTPDYGTHTAEPDYSFGSGSNSSYPGLGHTTEYDYRNHTDSRYTQDRHGRK